jgi:hypothetical protein
MKLNRFLRVQLLTSEMAYAHVAEFKTASPHVQTSVKSNPLTPECHSWNMNRLHSKVTKLEMLIGKALQKSGLCYRFNVEELPIAPDVFSSDVPVGYFGTRPFLESAA